MRPSPKFVNKLSGEFGLPDLIIDESSTSQNWYKQSLQPLKPTGQPKEGDRNFFVQGLMIGFVFLVLPIVTGTIMGGVYVACKVYSHWN